MVADTAARPSRQAHDIPPLERGIREQDTNATVSRALASAGVPIAGPAVRDEIARWDRDGLRLRRGIRERARALFGAEPADIRSVDETLWERFPRVAGFAYGQARALGRVLASPLPAELAHELGVVAASFNVAISWFDHLVDERGRTMMFELLDTGVIAALLEEGPAARAALTRGRRAAPDPLVRATIEIAGVCAAGARAVNARAQSPEAWGRIATLVHAAYAAEQLSATRTPDTREELREMLPVVEAKSVIPSRVTAELVALVADASDGPALAAAGEAVGRVVWQADELADVVSDYYRGLPSSVVLAVADAAVASGRATVAPSDLAATLEQRAGELASMLEARRFAADPAHASPIATFAVAAVAAWVGAAGAPAAKSLASPPPSHRSHARDLLPRESPRSLPHSQS